MPTEIAPPDPLGCYVQARRLGGLRDWARVQDFTALPDDWQVFVADVVQSTQAIAQGRYKQVNAAGAACVVAAANACGRDDLPFVFGGDGASLAVPPAFADPVARAWRALRARVGGGLGLDLRIGRVPVAELRARGADLQVARHALPAGFDLALFAGGGLTLADQLVKQDPERWCMAEGAPDSALSVEGLECRWNDVPARRGRILTLLVRARGEDPLALAEVLAQIGQVLPHAAPVRTDNLPLSWPPHHLGTELALRRTGALRRPLTQAGVWLMTGLLSRIVRRQAGDVGTEAGRYVASLALNTDHLKLDDTFRAVLDVTPSQAGAIESVLAQLQSAGRIDHGLHASDHALMTCFVRSRERHVHFVDGADGGYAVAAARLKAQAAAAAGISTPTA